MRSEAVSSTCPCKFGWSIYLGEGATIPAVDQHDLKGLHEPCVGRGKRFCRKSGVIGVELTAQAYRVDSGRICRGTASAEQMGQANLQGQVLLTASLRTDSGLGYYQCSATFHKEIMNGKVSLRVDSRVGFATC